MLILATISALAAVVAVVAAVVAVFPILQRYWNLYHIPRKALLMHRALLCLERQQLVFQDKKVGEPVSPLKAHSIYIHLWWDYRRLCKYAIEPNHELMGKVIYLFEQHQQRYVTTQQLETHSLAMEQTLSPTSPLDYRLANWYSIEYTCLLYTSPSPRDS